MRADAFFNISAHSKCRYAYEKPADAKLRANLPPQIQRFIGIIPHIPSEYNIHNHTYKKFKTGYDGCTKQAPC